jgi:hypothetical protein
VHRNARRLPLPPTMIHSHATPPVTIGMNVGQNRCPQRDNSQSNASMM